MITRNKQYVENAKNFANEPVLQLALREMQSIINRPQFWLGFAAVIVLLAIMGPFRTLNLMSFSERLVYWAVISFVTFLVGSIISLTIGFYAIRLKLPRMMSWVLAGLVTGVPIGALVWGMNTHIFDLNIAARYSFPQFLGFSVVITTMIVLLSSLLANRGQSAEMGHKQNQTASPFFDRLAFTMGRELISIEAQDHYLNVTTKGGSELILMRMGDAVSELVDYPGLRVHRSWWVGMNQIEKVQKREGKTELLMANKTLVPVSRSYLKQLNEKGIR